MYVNSWSDRLNRIEAEMSHMRNCLRLEGLPRVLGNKKT